MGKIPLDQRMVNELVRESRNLNIFPLFFYQHFTINPKTNFERLLCGLVKECYDYLYSIEDQEIVDIARGRCSWKFHDLQLPFVARESQLADISLNVVASVVGEKYTDFKSAIENVAEAGPILKTFPELSENFDHDGLLLIDDRFSLGDGGVFYKEHVLHYHQFLRRGYTSNPNFEFLGAFALFCKKNLGRCKCRVAIDHRRLMRANDYQHVCEMDAWFGPPFDEIRLDDPSHGGLSVHIRNKYSLFHHVNLLERTEFYWSYSKGIKTFELEEISSRDYMFDRYNFNRYVHSERDVSAKIFRHVDGAVKVYDGHNYSRRLAVHLPEKKISSKKIKLWRIDGDIELKDWAYLVSLFTKGNEMVIEYFNPEAFRQMFDLRIRDYEAWKAQQG